MEDAANQLLEKGVTIVRRPPELMPDEDAGLFEDSLRYRTEDVFLRDLGKASLSPDSVVYKGGRVLEETLTDPSHKGYYQFRHFLKKALLGKRVDLGSARHLLATDAWSVGHYHWFAETLPRLWLIRDIARDFVLLLPDSEYVKTVGMDSLRMLGLEFADIVHMDSEGFYSAEKLSFVSRIAGPGRVHDRIMGELRSTLVGSRPFGERRLYISRSNARFRKILNEDEVVDWAVRNGFETIRNEELDLAGQIDAFSGASVVLGIHGAGLTDALFMNPTGVMVEICKRERNHAYWHLADSVGMRYRYYHGTADSDRSLFGEGCNLSVEISKLEESLT